MNLISLSKDLLDLIYPNLCLLCPNALVSGEEFICTSCLVDLPKTTFEFGKPNLVEQVFWGRVKLEAAISYYWFEKGGHVQKILHHIKYKGNKQLGVFYGRIIGLEIKKGLEQTNIDVICPVPLHKKKNKIRGFNQSELLANGISGVIQKPVLPHALKRKTFTSTQTRKTKIDRWENVKEVFGVADVDALKNKHVLIVDDVVTTGATLDACAQSCLENGVAGVSVATLAFTL